MSDAATHFAKLERLYLSAPVNEYYRPSIDIGEGRAEVVIAARPDLLHAAGAVHGSVYFKLLDDACFFAVNSLVPDVFVLTATFNTVMLRPVSDGAMRGVGRVVHAGRRLFHADGEVIDRSGNVLARGSGSFMRSSIALDESVGYT